MFDYLSLFIVMINGILFLLTASKQMHSKIKEIKELSNINKQLNIKVLSINEDYNNLNIHKLLCDFQKSETNYKNLLSEKELNIYNLYLVMQFSSEYFSRIYKNNDLFCNLRIKQDNSFKTIVQYYSDKKSKSIDLEPQKYYSIDNNIDLINISQKNYNIFVINNISDYKKNNHFILQNRYMEEHCKAIITLPIYIKQDNLNLIACHTIYFSKPLDERIEIKNFDNSFSLLVNKLNELIKKYIRLNIDKMNILTNEVITNENLIHMISSNE